MDIIRTAFCRGKRKKNERGRVPSNTELLTFNRTAEHTHPLTLFSKWLTTCQANTFSNDKFPGWPETLYIFWRLSETNQTENELPAYNAGSMRSLPV